MPRKSSRTFSDKSKGKEVLQQSSSNHFIPPPKWPALSPLVPLADLALENLLQNQIFIIRNLFTSNLSKRYVSFLSRLPLVVTPSQPKEGDALRVNDRIQFDDPQFAQQLWTCTALQALIKNACNKSCTEDHPAGLGRVHGQEIWGGEVCGLNPRIRIYRYRIPYHY